MDAKIAAWGLAFEDRAETVSPDGTIRHSADTAEDALARFGFGTHIRPHLIWHDPWAATPDEDD